MITALIIFFIFCVVMTIVKSRQPKQAKQQAVCKDTHKVIKISVDLSNGPKHSPEYYEKRRKRTITRGTRMDRHGRIWSVLFLVNTIYQLEECKQRGYIDRKLLNYLERAKAEVLERKPTRSDIETAIKFCNIEYARGMCPHKLSVSDIKSIMHIYDVARNPSAYTPK